MTPILLPPPLSLAPVLPVGDAGGPLAPLLRAAAQRPPVRWEDL